MYQTQGFVHDQKALLPLSHLPATAKAVDFKVRQETTDTTNVTYEKYVLTNMNKSRREIKKLIPLIHLWSTSPAAGNAKIKITQAPPSGRSVLWEHSKAAHISGTVHAGYHGCVWRATRSV
jgi:hypothetical protein